MFPPVFRIFKVCTDVDACDCAGGLNKHCERICTKVDSRGSPLTQGIEPLSALCLALYIHICFYLKIIISKRAGMTQLVLHLTEKPGAILMQV